MNQYKERRTDTHVYFVGGPFSQWYNSKFGALVVDETGIPDNSGWNTFTTAEQYMMANKALLFGDEEVFNAIMHETNPRKQKELGRQVRGFDPVYWERHARDIVFRGNIEKFKDPIFFGYLMGTDDKTLVEGAHYDPVWGVKLAFDDYRIEDTTNWRGTNWLGQVLMKVRDTLRQDSNHYPWGYAIDWSKEKWK